MNKAQQQALAAALTSLFGEDLGIALLPGGFGFSWKGQDFGCLIWQRAGETEGMALPNIVSAALQTAHDTVLEGMGNAGTDPGPLATSTCDFAEVPGGFRVRLKTDNGSGWRVVTLTGF